MVEVCNTETCLYGLKTDHLPMLTALNLEIPIAQPTNIHNYHEIDWGEF